MYIAGGTFVVTGWASGIGTGYADELGTAGIGRLEIANGTFVARSTARGSGIGTGWSSWGMTFIKSLVIGGGSFEAWSSTSGAGIGTAFSENGISTIEQLIIRNATVSGIGTYGCAGIGTGRGWHGASLIVELIIEGSTITARGPRGAAGIGTGWGDWGNSSIERVTIRNSTVRAIASEKGAGIGTGWGHAGIAAIVNLTLDQGTFECIGESSPGVGAGYADFGGLPRVDRLVITDGTFKTKGIGSSGIGAGMADQWNSSQGTSVVGQLVIQGGTFEAIGENGAVIGVSNAVNGTSQIHDLRISGGSLNLSGLSWIGSYLNQTVDSLTIENNYSWDCSSAGVACLAARNITLNGAKIDAITNTTTFLAGLAYATRTDLVVRYRAPSGNEAIRDLPAFHASNIVRAHANESYTLAMSQGSWSRDILIPPDVKGVLASGPRFGQYAISLNGSAITCGGKQVNSQTVTIDNGVVNRDDWPSCESPDPGSLDWRLIVGISVAAVVLIVSVAVIIYCVRSRRGPVPELMKQELVSQDGKSRDERDAW
jgi:hypothetical protein